MKKTILSPICSALIIPGLGQVLNGNLKKGLILLALVFLLFLGAAVKLIFFVQSLLNRSELPSYQISGDIKTFQVEFLSSLSIIFLAFAVIWIYAVLDAFWTGRKLEKDPKREAGTQ